MHPGSGTRRLRAWTWTLMLVPMVVSGCLGSSSPSSTAGGQVVFASSDNIFTFDPATSPGGNAEVPAMMLVYDRLIHFDSKSQLVPELASSWTSAPNSVTLTLKKGPTCSDGTPITPAVVADSLKRMGAAATKSALAPLTIGSAGYSVTTDDTANTVTVTTAQPFGDLLIGLAMPWASIVCPAGIKAPNSLATAPAGSGPYTLSAVGSSSYTFSARSDYNWGPNGMTSKQAGYPKTIVIKTNLSDEATAASEMLRGELDVFMFQGNDRTRFNNNNNFKTAVTVTPGAAYMSIKEEGIFVDPKVRQAIYMSLDPKALNQAIYSGFGVLSPSIVGTQSDCFDAGASQYSPKLDPAAAKTILDQDGWVVGSDGTRSKNGQQLSIRVMGRIENGVGNDYILAQLQALGFKVTQQILDIPSWLNGLYVTLNFDLTNYPNGGAIPTPSQAFNLISGTNTPTGRNIFHVHAVDQAVTDARTTAGATRCQNWAAAQEGLLQGYHALPYSSASNAWTYRKGITLNPILDHFDPFTIAS